MSNQTGAVSDATLVGRSLVLVIGIIATIGTGTESCHPFFNTQQYAVKRISRQGDDNLYEHLQ